MMTTYWLFSIIITINALENIPSGGVHIRDDDGYPIAIQLMKVRRDIYTKKPVKRGLINKIGNFISTLSVNQTISKISLNEFKSILQCVPKQPSLTNKISSLLYPTNELVEIIATYMEAECSPWSYCKSYFLPRFKMGLYPDKLRNRNQLGARFFRIINNTLYHDWPWGIQRFTQPDPVHTSIFLYILHIINNIPNSIFIMSEEIPIIPWDVPFPGFSNSPAFDKADLPAIWTQTFINEMQLYRKYIQLKNISTSISRQAIHINGEEYHNLYTSQIEWSKRIEKASFYGNFGRIRQVIFDLATLYPDLIDARWTYPYVKVAPWNPLSSEAPIDHLILRQSETESSENILPTATSDPNKIGYISNIINLRTQTEINANSGGYKYVVVLLGLGDGKATSGRLAELLAHSGAVILLQESKFTYHFSPFLIPWVHFVPISYALVDLIDKINWLKKNDMLARRIAQNAKVFGRSYLRLEDHFCYAASSLEYVGELAKHDVNVAKNGFNIMPIPPYDLVV